MRKGSKHSEETKRKLSLAKKGKHYSLETEFKKGHVSPKYWLGKKGRRKGQFTSEYMKERHSNSELHAKIIKPLLEHNQSIKKYSSLAEKRKADLDRDRKHRLDCLIHYGGNPPKCARCGYSDIRSLCIDHIKGGGNKERRGHGRFERILVKKNFPEGYQVLCANCNIIKKIENREF